MPFEIKNLNSETLSQCFTVDKNTVIFYLKANKFKTPFYFDVTCALSEDIQMLINQNKIDILLTSEDFYKHMIEAVLSVDNNTLYLASKKERELYSDIKIKLMTQQFNVGNIVGKYLDNSIYEYLLIDDKKFMFLGVAIDTDMCVNEYAIDKNFIVIYNNISYQYKGAV